MPLLRTIVESSSASAELDKLRTKYNRFSDWWDNGWSWRLARDPFTDATKLPNTMPQVYLLKTSENHVAIGFPFTLTMMYTVNDNEVNLEAIRYQELEKQD